MKLLIAKSDEAHNFISIHVKLYKLVGIFRISLCDNLCKCIGRLTDIIDLCITNSKLIHMKIIELDLLIH